MKKFLLFFSLLLLNLNLGAQVKGKVTDSDGNPLSTVNIYIENSFIGTTTNDDGFFELALTRDQKGILVFKYLGFKTIKRDLTDERLPLNLDIVMQEERFSLDEVVVSTDDNPANRIIRMAIANRKNMLDKISTFKAKFYSRGLIRIKNAPEKILGRDLGDLGGGLDSTRSGIVYLSETISEISFEQPNNLYEKIKASKVSGDDSGFSFNTASDVNFNFYQNTIELGNQIVSPIADYAFSYYRYRLEGISYDENGNLINKISVIPRRENDRIFKGTIYIVEDQWSIYALELDITGEQAQIPPADVITLNQRFSFSDKDRIWVLISQNIDFSFSIFGVQGSGNFRAVYSNYNFPDSFKKGTFTKEILSFENAANKKDSLFWVMERPVPLTVEELTDYIKKDSIQILRKSKPYQDSIDTKGNKFKMGNLLTGYNHQNSYEDRYWSISGPLSKLSYNTVQGWKPGLRLNFRKNYDDFNRYFEMTHEADYGISDKKFRFNSRFVYKFNNISRPYLALSGGNALRQFNPDNPIEPNINSISSLFFEDNYMKLYERVFVNLAYSEEWFNGLRFFSNLSYEQRKPVYNNSKYRVIDENDDEYSSNNPVDESAFGISPFEKHSLVRLNLGTTITFGQTYMSYPDGKFNLSNPKYPRLQLRYRGGLGSTVSDYNYHMIMGRLFQSFDVGNKGYFQYNLKAGTFINGDDIAFMDYKHFNGNQTHVGTQINYTNVFNNLPYYERSTNSGFIEFHAEHDFRGFIMGKIPALNTLNFNLILGAHALATENSNPYYEFSIGLDNIGFKKIRVLRLDYVRSYQGGFKNDAIVFGLKFLDFID
ncbi:MAG: DUF5686 and carboxypeptidase regulatory-like domain-containing protein [Bacteroidia bacterium]|nr:DUF5686 and carboxypeptidase regulatory-like domain-containing protein [Bacteroidia bacterium]MBT8268830.1 DUF5686 and carboxypeptidase regulatory-like domain-containing protein [Bacteroidia bacterium]NNL79136.1 carboxypeptidase-like regulatory domain-containing protein [Flavobacteriaceae bacterium]